MLAELLGRKKPEKFVTGLDSNPEKLLHQLCAKHGPFKRELDGTVVYEDYLVMRAISLYTTWYVHKPDFYKFREECQKALKANNHTAYRILHGRSEKIFMDNLRTTIRKINFHCELDEKNYELTLKKHLSNEEKSKVINSFDFEMRASQL